MRFRVGTFILIVSMLMGACGNPSTALPTIPVESTPAITDGTPTTDGVTITYGVFDYERTNFEPIIARFHEEHPSINVVLTSLDDVLQSTPDASGNYPVESMTASLRRVVSVADVAPASWVTPDAYGTPLLRDIKPYLDGDTSFDRTDFYPSVLERHEVNGAQYVLPRTVSLQSIAYNRDAMNDAQVPPPTCGWKSSDLFAIAEKLTKVNNGQIERYGWYDNSSGSMALLMLFEEAGVDILSMGPNDLKIGDTKVLNALQKYADLTKRGVIYATPGYMAYGARQSAQNDTTDPTELIKSGKIAIWVESALYSEDGGVPDLPFEIGFTSMPNGPHENLNFYTEGLIMSGGTVHPNEAWTLMEWLSRQNLNPGAAVGYAGYMGARKSLQAQMAPGDTVNQARAEAYVYTLSHMQPLTLYQSNDYMVYYTISSAVYGFIESPPKSASDVLSAAVKNIKDNQKQAQQTPSLTPDLRPVVVVTPEPDVATADQTTITFAAYGASLSDMRRYVRTFKNEDDSIFVKLISTDSLTTTQTFVTAAARSDCFWWNQGIPISDADRAALADLQPLIDNDSTVDMSDVPLALLDMYRGDGRLVGFPHSYTARGLVYQDALFTKLGLETPRSNWSTDDFLRAAKAMTSDGVFGYSSMGNYIGDLIFWSNRFGGNMVSGTGKEIRANFADPQVVNAVKWWTELATTHKVMPMPIFDYKRGGTSSYESSWELQSQGKIGMWFDYGNTYAKPEQQMDPATGQPSFTTLMAPPPLGTSGLVSGDVNVTGYHISATATDAPACMKFINFLSRQTAVNTYGNIPARKTLSYDPLFEEQNAYALPLRDALSELLDQPLTVTADISSLYVIDNYWIYQALDNIIYKSADTQAELQAAQTKTNSFLACVATIDNRKGSPTYASCAKKADPTYDGYMSDEGAP